MARRDIGTDDPRVRVRPGKHRRPRTKKRPDYSSAPCARVISVDRGRYHLDIDSRRVIAVKARSLGRHGVITGDRVRVEGDISGADGSLARIVDIEPRDTELVRSAEDNEVAGKLKPIVANADRLAIVCAAADPMPRVGMIDRCIVAAYAAGMNPIVIMTKVDLKDPCEFLHPYRALDIQCYATSIIPDLSGNSYADSTPKASTDTNDHRHGEQRIHEDVAEDNFGEAASSFDRLSHAAPSTQCDLPGLDVLAKDLAGHETVLLGHSGVGKSTLMNVLIPEVHRSTGHVNEVTGKGRHTSSSALAHPFPGGGWLIDTPGIRGFGLAHVDSEIILAAFDDLAHAAVACPKGCEHLVDTPDCALDKWARDNDARGIRLQSFRRLVATPSSHSMRSQ
ncbi:MAG: ribosome small subunit-dependent GTPase A [Actinomycetaceae bacterium]|nr:ribosome small subunit-dependent GTPase A [Actinomycetaceae bacterium]